MNLFLRYIRDRRGGIILFFAFAAVFAAVDALYSLPLSAALYPVLICACVGLCILAAGFTKYKKRHEALTNLTKQAPGTIENVPRDGSLAAQDYCAVIDMLSGECRRLETAALEERSGLEEYYTLWAHQIKTPIASMKLRLQNEDSALSRELLSDLARIEQYVEMVLVYIRLESPSTDYRFESCDIDEAVKETVKKFSQDFIGRKIRLDYAPLEMKVITDRKWLCFVIGQVISNALKYTREGGISIYREDPDTLCISDTGIGIAQGDLPRIFEKGFTGVNGRTDTSSSGIGLYLCRRICESLGHTISAQSEVGKGTTVRICLAQKKLKHE